jgi:hypothetical protein
MFTLLAGAGFSRWAAGLPVARELFDFAIKPFGVREEAHLRRVQGLKKAWDRKNPQGLAEEFVGYALAAGGATSVTVRWYVVRRLSEPYIWQEWHAQRLRRHVLMIDEDRRQERPGVRQVNSFVRQLGPGLRGVITTNYDLLIEYALGSGAFNYGIIGERLQGRGPYPVSQWNNPVTLRGALPLAKMHGSISWDENGRYTDGRRGLSGEALIVAPGPAKKPPRSLRREWALSGKILRSCGSLVVFGFAFNPYDHAILDHLKSQGAQISDVLLIDIAPNLEVAAGLWPRARVHSAAPPPKGDAEIQEWLKDTVPSNQRMEPTRCGSRKRAAHS